MASQSDSILCSKCFYDQGLVLDAMRLGSDPQSTCPSCREAGGAKLDRQQALRLAHSFFVFGSTVRFDYGYAPLVQFNDAQATSIDSAPWLECDLQVLGEALGVGFFYYGPRFWMFGEVEPLKDPEDPSSRPPVLKRILDEYPSFTLTPQVPIYRIRRAPAAPSQHSEYDAPPPGVGGQGRLDSDQLSALYASPDLELCIHECRITAEDETFVATLEASRDLALLDLTEVLEEKGVTEFDSLDLAVHMLFLAGDHSYPISRDIALAAWKAGFDGLVYPSYFSLLRTGAPPLATSYGISHRRFPELREHEKSKIVPNIALFGRPIDDGKGHRQVHQSGRLAPRRLPGLLWPGGTPS